MYNLANNAWSRLAEPVGASDTTITVASAILFPEPPFVVSVADEILEVTNVSGNTFTVVRGVEGTSSASYPQGERVDARFTAGVYGGLKDTILNHLEDIDNPHNLLADLIPFSPADPASDWEPTKVADALDILADSRIVEQGENENGEYWRWENGLQICYLFGENIWEKFDFGSNSEKRGVFSMFAPEITWNHPARFLNVSCFLGSVRPASGNKLRSGFLYGLPSEAGGQSTKLRLITDSDADNSTYYALLVIGRWK